MNWFFPAASALVIFGIWGFLPKLATQYLSPQSALLYEVVGALLFGLVALLFFGIRPETDPKGIVFAILAGFTALLGGLFYLIAVSRGNVAVVVAMTAMYPVVTILMAYLLLNEPVTAKQGLGIACSFVAIALFAS